MTRTANPIGRCALCKGDGVELQKSHLVPAGAFRRLRDDNRHPALITRGKMIETARQTWAHLLCRSCEQRLATRGEAWVLANGLQSDRVTFPLLQHLMATKAATAEPTLGIFQPQISGQYDPSAIAYFAASMFWRASAHSWGQPDLYPIRLGSKYGEQLRLFLMDHGPFPERALLLTVVRAISPVSTLTAYPCSVEGDSLVHIFFCVWALLQPHTRGSRHRSGKGSLYREWRTAPHCCDERA
jgi:hypothetical protein